MEPLTNYEVLTWLHARKSVRDLAGAPVRDAASLISQAVVLRAREVRWVEHKATKFLSAGPAARQSLALLAAISKAVGKKTQAWGITLSQKQMAQLLDAQPTTALDLYLCIDDCPALDEARQEELAETVAAVVTEHDAAASAAAEAAKAAAALSEPPTSTAAGMKRSRSNSSATGTGVTAPAPPAPVPPVPGASTGPADPSLALATPAASAAPEEGDPKAAAGGRKGKGGSRK